MLSFSAYIQRHRVVFLLFDSSSETRPIVCVVVHGDGNLGVCLC